MAGTTISTIQKVTGKSLYQTTLGQDNDLVLIGKEGDLLNRLSPQISFSKWNGEEKLSIEYEGLSALTPSLVDGKIEIGNTKEGFYFDRNSDELFKFGLILKSKPSTNTWSFQLQGWENFDFFYQTPLTNITKEENGYITGTDSVNGWIGVTRPKEIDGSWAVYHKTKRNHVIGQTNYQCGKFGNFHHLRILDADGKQIGLGDIDIKDGVYSLTIEQTILDNAKYPVKFNDVFGSQSEPTTAYSYGLNGSVIIRGTLGGSGGDVTKLTHWLKVSGTDGYLKGVIFDDDGASSEPTTLKGSTPAVHFTNVTAAWFDSTFSSAITLAAGNWFLGWISGGGVDLMYDAASEVTRDTTAENYATPANWNPAIDNPYTSVMGCYATYTAGGGGATTNVVADLLTLTSSLNTPAYNFDHQFTPTMLSLTSAIQDPAKNFDYNFTPSILSITSALLTPTEQLGCVLTPSLLSLTASILDPTKKFDHQFTPELLSMASGLIEPNKNYDYLYAVASLALTSGLLDPSLFTGILITPDLLTMTAGLLSPTVCYDYLLQFTDALNLTATLQDTTVNFDYAIDISALALQAGLLDPTVIAAEQADITVTADLLNLTSVLLDPVAIGSTYIVYNSTARRLEFWVAGIEVMRINSDGTIDAKGTFNDSGF